MANFLILQDFHIAGKNPCNRIDDYRSSCLLKLDEIVEISKKCDYVISAGDLWDSAVVVNSLVDDVVDRIESSKRIWYFIYGNHDILNYNIESSSSVSLTHMIRRSKWIQHLDILQDKNYYIKGYDCQFGKETELKEKGLMCNYDADFKIAITHQFITIKPFHPQVLHVQAKDIQNNYDLIICSHFHSQFDKTINKTRFLNLGELGRVSISEAHHEPQVAIIDTETKQIEIIKLKSAKPANEIFDLSKYEEIKENEKSIEDFIASLNSATWQACDLRTQIQTIGKEQNVEKEVINYGLNILDKIKIGE
jgi:predicted phosphodiesterase